MSSNGKDRLRSNAELVARDYTPDLRARGKIQRAIDDLDRYGPRTVGRRDAKFALVQGIEELIDAKVEMAIRKLIDR
ncbi:hypothetical protein [Microvirga massiliensis]|uniref:hypothetical protein n=1 Tax=Microvirga massiliensis TaxID=1033741 RepID=UPI00062BACF4|nr:hypothetical protein [Microvirga massiliensis]